MLGWSIPLQFELVQYDACNGRSQPGWRVLGTVASIRPASEPVVPPDVMAAPRRSRGGLTGWPSASRCSKFRCAAMGASGAKADGLVFSPENWHVFPVATTTPTRNARPPARPGRALARRHPAVGFVYKLCQPAAHEERPGSLVPAAGRCTPLVNCDSTARLVVVGRWRSGRLPPWRDQRGQALSSFSPWTDPRGKRLISAAATAISTTAASARLRACAEARP
jgi:hypothetical protein